MKELSVLDVMVLRPCYSEDKVKEVFNGRDKLTLLDILDLDIPAKDKVWVLTRPGILPDAILKEFAALAVDRAVRQHCLSCGLPTVEAWAVKWLDGSDRSAEAARAAYEAREARGAAWAAGAAYEARAAYEAAYEAAYRAACAACAAYLAVSQAACEAEWQQQVADLRRLIDA